MRDAQHPFLLWTRQEAAELRKRIQTDPDAKRQYEKMVAWESSGRKFGRNTTCATMMNLFNYLVLGDRKAGAAEMARLLRFPGTRPTITSDRHMREEQTLYTLRYDVLYDQLTPQQRKKIEDTFRVWIDFHLSGHKPWHPDFRYDRVSWLPNMHWPRAIGTHLMAVALKDEKLIRAMFHSQGGWKWFMHGYLADGRFYMEEFGKQYSNIGTMLLYCEALEHLGLGQYGYGYKGKGGATMRSFLESWFYLGYPRTGIPGGMANYRRITMGDARGSRLRMRAFEHSIVTGYLPDGQGGNLLYGSGHMNGPLPKMRMPLWFEMGHRRWPDAGFDYFLAQMRAPGEDRYCPTLYFGCGPIDPKKVKPPPAPSYVAPERGFALLRAEEGPGYWESPKPAVALQFGMYYVHYVHDCFAILGCQAFNRPIYLNRAFPRGYAGGDPWIDSVRGHCGVVVDNKQARYVDNGNHGTKNHRLRHGLHRPVKFVAARARGIYEGVDQERALFLTDQYLLDVFRLNSNRPRTYDWSIHTLGSHQPEDPKAWKPTSELDDGKLYDWSFEPFARRLKSRPTTFDLMDVRKMAAGDKGWSFRALQSCQLGDPSRSRLGRAWYDRRIGVRVSMLGEPGTTVFVGKTPNGQLRKDFVEPEVGGVTLLVRRKAPSATFVALHEPFEGGLGKHRVEALERIQQTAQGLAVRVVGKAGSGIDDRVVLRTGDDCHKPLRLSAGGESFTFADYAFVRVGKEKVEVLGRLKAMKLEVTGAPRLFIDGKEQAAKVANGILSFEAR